MRILTRYILREVLSHALLGGVLFTFVLFMRDLGRILELLETTPAARVAALPPYCLRSRWWCWLASCWALAGSPQTAR